jgi:hypothetical protein
VGGELADGEHRDERDERQRKKLLAVGHVISFPLHTDAWRPAARDRPARFSGLLHTVAAPPGT